MDSFCHALAKPAGGRLHAKKADHFVNIVLVLKNRNQCLSAELDSRRHPKVVDLLQPCGKLTASVYGAKLTVQDDGEDIFADIRTDSLTPSEALHELLEASCQQSKALADSMKKRRDTRNVSDEACQLLVKIEQQRKEEFAKYVLLLNEKKRKIRELQQQLAAAEVTEEVDDDDHGLRADVQKWSQDTNQSGSPKGDDRAESPTTTGGKCPRIGYRAEISDDDAEEDEPTKRKDEETKDDEAKEDGDSDQNDDDLLFDSDEDQSVKGGQSDSGDHSASDDEDDNAKQRTEKRSNESPKRNTASGKDRVVSDDDEDIDDKVVESIGSEEEQGPSKGRSSQPIQSPDKRKRHAIISDEDDSHESPKTTGGPSPAKLRAVKTITKPKRSGLDDLDDLL